MVAAVAAAGDLDRPVDGGAGRVDLVDVVHALQDRGHPLQTQPGVDVLVGQIAQDREVVLALPLTTDGLHEHEVPDLEVAILVSDRAALASVLGAAVVVDLTARSTRSGYAHAPEVVGHAAALDAAGGQTHEFLPEVGGLVIVVVDRHPELVLGEPVATLTGGLGEQIPGEGDGAFLEVVAEGEVAAHLEERRVTSGLADLLDVEGAHDLLHAGRALVRRHGLAQEVRLERDHARVDEQQCRVVEQQRRTRHHGVAALGEELQKATSDFG